jgi:hypothetical protein
MAPPSFPARATQAAGEGLRITGHRTVPVDDLSEAEKERLLDTLYALHARIFAGVSREEFDHHVIRTAARRTTVTLLLNRQGDTVGYCAVHLFARALEGRPCTIIRAEAGLLPEYRGRATTLWFGMTASLAEKLRHPGTPLYYLGTLVHPSSYHLFFKYFPGMFPSPTREGEPDLSTIARTLADSFPDPPADPTDPLVRQVGWVTIETPAEREMTQKRREADVRYFLSRNPGFLLGEGLVVLIPISFGCILGAIRRRLTELAFLYLGLKKERF